MALGHPIGQIWYKEGDEPDDAQEPPRLMRGLEDVDDVYTQRLGEVIRVDE